ncbi:HNH endonuclease [Streptosporangium sandarakinum]
MTTAAIASTAARPNSAKRQRYRRQLAERDGARCFYCARRFRDLAEATLDHLVPTYYGGTWARANLVLACAPCNEAKGHRMPSEFLRSRGFRPGLRPSPMAVLRTRAARLWSRPKSAASEGIRPVRRASKGAGKAVPSGCVRPVLPPSSPLPVALGSARWSALPALLAAVLVWSLAPRPVLASSRAQSTARNGAEQGARLPVPPVWTTLPMRGPTAQED